MKKNPCLPKSNIPDDGMQVRSRRALERPMNRSSIPVAVAGALGLLSPDAFSQGTMNAADRICADKAGSNVDIKVLCEQVKIQNKLLSKEVFSHVLEKSKGEYTIVVKTVGGTDQEGLRLRWGAIKMHLKQKHVKEALAKAKMTVFADKAETELSTNLIPRLVAFQNALPSVAKLQLDARIKGNLRQQAKQFKVDCYRLAHVEILEIRAALFQAKELKGVETDIQKAIELCEAGMKQFNLTKKDGKPSS